MIPGIRNIACILQRQIVACVTQEQVGIGVFARKATFGLAHLGGYRFLCMSVNVEDILHFKGRKR